MWEEIVQNAQKGEIYSIKFRNDPIVYKGIPLVSRAMPAGRRGEFEIEIIQPEPAKGIRRANLRQIERMEVCR
jgi:hypothetical protein